MKNKNLLIILLFLIRVNLIFSNDIILSPISKSLIYSNFSDNLFPFLYSSKIIEMHNTNQLLLLDEFDYFNGFFGDVLKVRIIEGANKGFEGFILEENVAIQMSSIKNDTRVSFKDDRNMNKYRIFESKITYYGEVLTLKKEGTNEEVLLSNKNNIRFIINKTIEIDYFLRNNYSIFKFIDTQSLSPIDGVTKDGDRKKSDNDGFLYLKEKSDCYLFRKIGYQKCYFKRDRELSLVFMNKLNKIQLNNDELTQFQIGLFNFLIKANSNKNVFINNIDGLSVLSYPYISLENKKIIDGFYIEFDSNDTSVDLYFNRVFDKTMVCFYNEDESVWEELEIIQPNNNKNIQIKKSGYYLALSEELTENYKFQIPEIIQSNYYILKKGNNKIYNSIFFDSNLTRGDHEFLFFSKYNPYKIEQSRLDFKKEKYVSNITNINNKSSPSKFNELFYNIWNRFSLKKNKILIEIDNNILEHLGDMTLIESNIIRFSNSDFKMEGYFDIVDEKKLYLRIKYVSDNIHAGNKYFIISPSLFDSELVIPCFYSYFMGIFELSFDGIFFQRKTNPRKETNKTKEYQIIMETPDLSFARFPKDVENSIYKVYFSFH